MDYKTLGLGLGYFSIALALAEVAAPGRIARALGIEGKTARNVVLAFGLRELMAGGVLLRGPAVASSAWKRVAGDAMDLAALGIATRSSTRKGAIAAAMGFVAGAALLDWINARGLDRQTGRTFPPLGGQAAAT